MIKLIELSEPRLVEPTEPYSQHASKNNLFKEAPERYKSEDFLLFMENSKQ